MTTIPFPISIALVGAPGSGKSAVADEFVKISADFFAENESTLKVIENAGNTFQDRAGIAMGVFGGWAEDIRAYYYQFEREQSTLAGENSFLTLGTSLENLAHSGVTLENILTGVQTPDAARRAQQHQVTMTLLTFLFMERFRYTFGFYVPHRGTGVILPGGDNTENQYQQRIDNALKTIFVNFGFRIQPLEGTVEEQAATMFETIKRIVENGPEMPEEAPEMPEEAPEAVEEEESVPTPDAPTVEV